MLLREVIITPFKDLYWKIKVQQSRDMLSMKSNIPRVKKAGYLLPVLPLLPIKSPGLEEEKGRYIAFDLRTRVGQPSDATKYKKYVRKFEEGSPQEWIDMLKDLEEIWTQNSMTGGTDRASTVRALVRGESAVAFETALQDARTNEEGEMVTISLDSVNKALEAVTHSVFPYRALETQRLWMNRKMFKPSELTTRQMAASINRLNNALPFFPTGSESSKFTEIEIIGLLEWSLPAPWRAKFDLDGYIPTLHSKTRLIEACEAIERNELVLETKSKEETSHSNKATKRSSAKASNKSGEKQQQSRNTKHYCSEHGNNPTHSTADCWTLKNRAKPSGQVFKDKRTFSNKNLRKEINLLSKKSSKRKVLDMYASVIKREQSKLDKKSNKRKKAIQPDSDSEDEMSVNVISTHKKDVLQSSRKKSKDTSNVIAEEKEYQKKLQWLKDHGDGTGDEGSKSGAGSSDESSSN